MNRDLKINGYVVGQPPNPPLWVAIIGAVLGWIADAGSTLDDVGRAAFFLGIAVWAYLELTEGVNNLRKGLGAVGLIYIFVLLASNLS